MAYPLVFQIGEVAQKQTHFQSRMLAIIEDINKFFNHPGPIVFEMVAGRPQKFFPMTILGAL
ncbi:MAG: hypothetical protein R2940_05110 [Syntrophotaleaceae bacterium]